MTTIRARAHEYLAMRRALGFRLTSFEQKLVSFVGYLEAHDLDVITVDAALAWATATPRSTDEVHWSRRLMVIRIFARHMAVLDPRTQVPPPDLLPHHYRRVTPYLFSDDEIERLMEAASRLRPALRGLTWRTLIGLLAVTGLRVSEACGLDRTDVDLDDLLLTVRNTKFRQTPAGPDPSQHRRGAARLRPHKRLTAHRRDDAPCRGRGARLPDGRRARNLWQVSPLVEHRSRRRKSCRRRPDSLSQRPRVVQR